MTLDNLKTFTSALASAGFPAEPVANQVIVPVIDGDSDDLFSGVVEFVANTTGEFVELNKKLAAVGLEGITKLGDTVIDLVDTATSAVTNLFNPTTIVVAGAAIVLLYFLSKRSKNAKDK